MSNIKALHENIPIGGNEPVPDIIELLEDALAHAKNGSLRSFAYAGVLSNGHIRTSFEANGKTFETLGALDYLKDRVLTDLRNRDE